MSIRIVIADENRIIRKGIKALLTPEADMEVIGEAKTGQESLHLAKKLAPDVVIIDISLPDMNGIDATARMVSEMPSTRVMALSKHKSENSILNMFKAGASGYILKDCSLEELTDGIRAVADGNKYLCQRITGVVISDYLRRCSSSDNGNVSPLSKREREVLRLLSEGESSKDIAAKLEISTKTIETHRRRITSKLGIKGIAGLTKYAIREGITSLDS